MFTALQSKRSFDNTFVNEIPPVYPFTGVPASSLAIIKLVTDTTTESDAVQPFSVVTVCINCCYCW